jgi:hypothetical protein
MPQLDFVLEMAARDDPDKWTFTRQGTIQSSENMTRWVDRLAGRMLMQFMTATGLAKANKGRAAWKARKAATIAPAAGSGLKPGMSRGGKELKRAGDKT